MAVVGEAKIVVTAVTKGVEGEIRRAFSSAATGVAEKEARNSGKKLGNALFRGMDLGGGKQNAFSKMAEDIKSLYPEADKAANAFTKLVRSGFVAQGGIGALLGSVGSLVGGLGALVGAAGGAAGALAGVAGAAVTLKVGLAVGKLALGGISQAVSAATKTNGGYSKSLKEMKFDAEEAALGVERAGINLEKAREGLARVSDLAPSNRTRREAMLAVREAELALRKAKDAEENPEKDKKGGTDPFANLTPAQKTFAKYLIGLQKDFKDLKEAAASGFLPILQTQMERLIKGGLLTILKERFYDIGRGLGLATEKFTDIFLSGTNLRRFNAVLGQIAETLPSFGTILGNVFSGLLSILKAADPLTRRFVSFLESKTGAFAKFLDVGANTGSLTKFFNKAGDLASKFGKIFGQTFSGLGNIVEANFSRGTGGYIIIEWLDQLSAGWKNADVLGLQEYFRGAAKNFVAMGNALGGAVETIIKSGSNPAISEFFKALDGGSYAFSQIVTGAVESAPALGRLVQTLTEIVAVFADSSQVTAFFDTLNYFAQGLSEALNSIKPVIDFIGGAILGPLSAITLLIAAFSKVSLVAIGFIGKMAAGFGVALPAALTKSTVALTKKQKAEQAALAASKAHAISVATASLQLKRQTLEANLHAVQMRISASSVAGATLGQKAMAVSTNLTSLAVAKSQLIFNTASIAVKGFGASMKVAMASNPIGWIVLLVGALVELGVALAGIHGENMQKAVDGVSASFERGATSAETWTQALLAVPDAFKNPSDSLEAFKKDVQDLKSAQERGGFALLFGANVGTTATADAFGAMGRSLANLATTDLPRAQKQMKAFAVGQQLTTREVAVAIDEMDEYKAELKKQADQMGINIGNTDTLTGKLKLAEFAMGTGAVAARYQADELANFQAAAASSASEMIDFAAALKKSTKDGKIDAAQLAKELKQQVTDSANYYKNLMELRARGVSEAYITEIEAMGPDAAKAAAALVKLTDLELKKAGIAGTKAGGDIVAKMAEATQRATTSGVLASAYAELGTKSITGFYNAIQNGKSVDEALRGLQAELYKKRMEIPAVLKMTPAAKAAFAREVGQAINFTLGTNKNGGYISAFKNGGFTGVARKFANGSGGPISGAGTARSDSIPTMLSNGEYVINARATANNRQLLDAINSNKNVSMAPTVHVTVNPSAGMDERALAAQVSRLIAFEIRRGNL